MLSEIESLPNEEAQRLLAEATTSIEGEPQE